MDNYKDRYKQAILDFTVEKVRVFLEQHPGETFYAFAYDYNTEYGEVHLCLNTEDQFSELLQIYQSEGYTQLYQSEDQIKKLKYNTGDWGYQCFDSIFFAAEEELDYMPVEDMADEDADRWCNEMTEICWEALREFEKTDVFRQISKTEDFVAYCIDHDEDPEDALSKIGHKF